MCRFGIVGGEIHGRLVSHIVHYVTQSLSVKFNFQRRAFQGLADQGTLRIGYVTRDEIVNIIVHDDYRDVPGGMPRRRYGPHRSVVGQRQTVLEWTDWGCIEVEQNWRLQAK